MGGESGQAGYVKRERIPSASLRVCVVGGLETISEPTEPGRPRPDFAVFREYNALVGKDHRF